MKFMIYGHPQGYYAQAARSKYRMSKDQKARALRYRGWQEIVRFCAMQNGIALPLIATKARMLIINTFAYFENGVHADPENVRKGIVDALFLDRTPGGTSDKYVGGFHAPPIYDAHNPRVACMIYSKEAFDQMGSDATRDLTLK